MGGGGGLTFQDEAFPFPIDNHDGNRTLKVERIGWGPQGRPQGSLRPSPVIGNER